MISTIGVIGGGQLGRMFALDAKRMGYYVVTLDPQEHSPCGQVADRQIVARYDDLDAIDALGACTDVVTYEFENIAIASVERLERNGRNVNPSSDVLRVTQDRILEKSFVRDCGIGTAAFAAIEGDEDVHDAAQKIGFPGILKTARGGYDGKGQWRVHTLDEARAAVREANGARLIWEETIDFAAEASVVATRALDGSVVTYPVGENDHDRGILARTIAPARIESKLAARVAQMATTIGTRLKIVGTYCVEFFITRDGDALVNEIAPRPHNSGHYTIDATQCSQYEQHVRAICGLPLAQPRLLSSAVMMNILGAGTGDRLAGVDDVLRDPSIELHMYGKKHAVDRRKMGHFTMLVDGTVDNDALQRATNAHKRLRWVEG